MPLSLLKDMRRIYAGLNAEEIRSAAQHEVSIGLMAATEEDYAEMEQVLVPGGLTDQERAEALRSVQRVDSTPPSQFDFVLCAQGVPLPSNAYAFNPANADSTARAIAAEHADLDLAIARVFPLFRRAVTDRIVQRVSRENAVFSIVTALPNVIPSFLDLPWAVGEFATDTAFLTMNQIRMAMRIAAAHGNPVGYAEQKIQLAAIVAGAFGWRALARELIGKVPLGAGLIPKAAVAFAGTYVVGLGLDKLNRTGSGLSKDEKKDAYARAFSEGKDVAGELVPTFTNPAFRNRG